MKRSLQILTKLHGKVLCFPVLGLDQYLIIVQHLFRRGFHEMPQQVFV